MESDLLLDAGVAGTAGQNISYLYAVFGSVFADHQTATYVWKTLEVRPLADSVVLLRAIVGMVPPGRSDVNPETNAVQSMVAVRDGDAWRVTLFQNTPAQYHGQPDKAEEHTAEMRRVLAAT